MKRIILAVVLCLVGSGVQAQDFGYPGISLNPAPTYDWSYYPPPTYRSYTVRRVWGNDQFGGYRVRDDFGWGYSSYTVQRYGANSYRVRSYGYGW